MYPHDIYVYLSFMPDTIEEIWLTLPSFHPDLPVFLRIKVFVFYFGSWCKELVAFVFSPGLASCSLAHVSPLPLASQPSSSCHLSFGNTTWTRHARVFNQVRVNVSENNVCPKLLLLQVLKHCIRQRCYRQWTQLASFGEYCDAARRQALKC